MENDQISKMLKLTRVLFFVNAAVWLFFCALSFVRAMTDTSEIRLILSWLMLANTIVMIWLGVMITRGHSWIVFFGILYMALNVVLSITDQFGWIDAVILLLNLCLLGILFVTRQRMNQAKASSEG